MSVWVYKQTADLTNDTAAYFGFFWGISNSDVKRFAGKLFSHVFSFSLGFCA